MIHTVYGLILGGVGGATLHFLRTLHQYLYAYVSKQPVLAWKHFLLLEALLFVTSFIFIVLIATGFSEIANTDYFKDYAFLSFAVMGYLSREVIDKITQKGRKTLDNL